MKKKKSIIGVISAGIIALIICVHFCLNINYNEDNVKASKGLFPVVLKNNKWSYMNSKGKIVMKKQFDYACPFSEGLAAVWINGKCGYINRKEEITIRPQFTSAGEFKCGRASVCNNDKWGYINKKGIIVIKPQYVVANNFSDGLAFVISKGKHKSQAMFIDRNGKIKINMAGKKYTNYFDSDFSEGLLPIEINNKCGFINKKGQMVIKPKYDRAQSFSEGLAAVFTNGRWGFIDKNENMIIRPEFADANSFSEGLAIVYLDDYVSQLGELKYRLNEGLGFKAFKMNPIGVIDKKGNVLFEMSESRLNYNVRFSNGLCCLNSSIYNMHDKNYKETGVKIEYIDKQGKPIYKGKYMFDKVSP
jgi:hypothetical protein